MKSSESPLPCEDENKAGPCGSIPKKLPSSHPELTEETRGVPTKVTMSPAAEQTLVPSTFLVLKGKKKKERKITYGASSASHTAPKKVPAI